MTRNTGDDKGSRAIGLSRNFYGEWTSHGYNGQSEAFCVKMGLFCWESIICFTLWICGQYCRRCSFGAEQMQYARRGSWPPAPAPAAWALPSGGSPLAQRSESIEIRAHACPERPVTQRKCPRTNKGIPIFFTAVQTREDVSQLFPLSDIRENAFSFPPLPPPLLLHYARRHRRPAVTHI